MSALMQTHLKTLFTGQVRHMDKQFWHTVYAWSSWSFSTVFHYIEIYKHFILYYVIKTTLLSLLAAIQIWRWFFLEVTICLQWFLNHCKCIRTDKGQRQIVLPSLLHQQLLWLLSQQTFNLKIQERTGTGTINLVLVHLSLCDNTVICFFLIFNFNY